MSLVEFVNLKLAVLTILAHIGIVVGLWYLIFLRKKQDAISNFFGKYGLFCAFIVALAATLSSLFYSEIAGYAPCTLCWYQRILMYPHVVLLGIAAVKKDKAIIKYALTLSVGGALLAGYHYLMQIGVVSSLACSAIGYSESCVKLFVMQFRYITLPLMSLTAFVAIIVLLMFVNRPAD